MNRALLVGINHYPDPRDLLYGCINDINDMAAFITTKCGFNKDDVRMLVDDRATAANIVDRLGWLLNGVRPGDRILFHYSGHGAQVSSRNSKGEADKIDETICPYDFNYDDPKTMIRDKDFVRLFKTVPEGVEFIWISDSCFSGGLSRAMLLTTKGAEYRKSKRYHLPPDIAWRNQAALSNRHKPLGMNKAATNLNVALIAGCTEVQESEDASFNNRNNGALTYFLLKELNTNKGLKESLTELVKKVVSVLQKKSFTQHPELLGSKAIAKTSFLQTLHQKK